MVKVTIFGQRSYAREFLRCEIFAEQEANNFYYIFVDRNLHTAEISARTVFSQSLLKSNGLVKRQD